MTPDNDNDDAPPGLRLTPSKRVRLLGLLDAVLKACPGESADLAVLAARRARLSGPRGKAGGS